MPIDEYAEIYENTFGGQPGSFNPRPDTYRTIHENNPGTGGFTGYYGGRQLGEYFRGSGNNILK